MDIYQMLSDGRDGGKAEQIQQWMSDYRRLAREQLLQEFPALHVEHAEKANVLRRFDPAMVGGCSMTPGAADELKRERKARAQ